MERNYERRLIAYLKPHYRTLFAGLFCAAVTAAITAGIAGLLSSTIEAMKTGRVGHLNFVCGAVLLVFMIKGVFTFWQSVLLSVVANKVATRLRDQIYAHLHSLPLSFFNQRRTGAIMSTLTNDVPVIQSAAMSLRDLVTAPITIVIVLVALFVNSWRLALVSLIFIPFMAVAITRIGKRIRAISGLVQGKLADISTILEETVAGVRIIKSFNAEEHEVERFRTENENALQTVMNVTRKSALLRPITEFIGAFGIALVLYLGGNYVAHTNDFQRERQQLYHGIHPEEKSLRPLESFGMPLDGSGMTEAQLIAFIYLLNELARAASNIGAIVTVRAQASAAAKRIFEEILDIESEVQEVAIPTLIPIPMEGNIRFENVSFRYGIDEPPVLKSLNFEIKPGEVVALVGKSGAGKSTLVDLIPRFYDPTEGTIFVDGVNLREAKLETLRKQIGIVPQETWLFAGTLRDNIAYGDRTATEEQVKNAAYSANAYFVDGMDKKFETIVGERGIRLSGGERQRIAIARAILMNPRILILDEATSSLDASSEALVQEALDSLMKGRTTIVIAHRLSTIINADRIIAMKDGEIEEMGSHRELLAQGGYYAQLYETQLRGFDF